MCGISGFSWSDSKLIKKMVDLQHHRGPDQNDTYVDDYISLGHNRLSILDLSKNGRQPMSDANGEYSIVFNGEVYNFQIIKDRLLKKGYRFISNTDTEVVLNAYIEYGSKCVSMFNGMFAFAIWDSKKRQLFMARDRSGIKPLYYYYKDGKLIFASEIKTILLAQFVQRNINKNALYKFLTFRYIPGEQTILDDIKKIPPASYVTFSIGKNVKLMSQNRYWTYSINPKKGSNYAKKLHNTLKDAVSKRLISDVPLGSFLSGGLDSSYIVGLMTQLSEEPVKTFSIGFDSGKGYDESFYSRFVAEHYGTDHHEFIVKKDSFHLLPKIMWHMDEPIADFAAIPTYMLSEFAKKKVSVVMTGEGADEILGGYRKYRYFKPLSYYYRALPFNARKLVSFFLKRFKSSLFNNRISEFSSSKSIQDFYLNFISYFTLNEKQKLCLQGFLESVKGQPDLEIINKYLDKKDLVNSMMSLDFNTWLPDDILMKVDKTTMAHSLEARVPFLDPNMLDLCTKIPVNQKIRWNTEKYVLKQAMKQTVPSEICKRRKHGFNVPVHDWIEKDMKDLSNDLLSKESIKNRGLFKHSYIEKLLTHYKKSKIFNSRQLWSLINFEIWARIYIDSKDIANKNIYKGVL